MFFFIAGHALAFGLIPWIPNISITAVVRGIVGYTFGGIDIGQYPFYPIRMLVYQITANTDGKILRKNIKVKEFLAIRRAISLNETFVLFVEIRTGDTRHIQQIHIDQSYRHPCSLVRIL